MEGPGAAVLVQPLLAAFPSASLGEESRDGRASLRMMEEAGAGGGEGRNDSISVTWEVEGCDGRGDSRRREPARSLPPPRFPRPGSTLFAHSLLRPASLFSAQ